MLYCLLSDEATGDEQFPLFFLISSSRELTPHDVSLVPPSPSCLVIKPSPLHIQNEIVMLDDARPLPLMVD